MRVLVWPAGRDASGYNRLIWPAEALAAAGHDVHVDFTGPTVHWDQPWTGDHPPATVRVLGCEKPDADVVVIQRPGRRWWADLIPHLHAHGIRVVVDVDDDFQAIHPRNRSWRAYNPRPGLTAHSWQWIGRACNLADLVTVTTPALAVRYGAHGRVQVLPNMVPERYLTIGPDVNLGIGWAGSVETHPDDLEVTRGAIARVCDTYDTELHVVGTGHGVGAALGRQPDHMTGWVPIEDYPTEVARIGVGIVPLADTTFNRAKSRLKMLEMAALGVPVVASPIPDNERLHRRGVGLLAKRPRDWERHLARLVTEDGYRAEIADTGRTAVADLTYEQQAEKWLTAWSAKVPAPV